MKRKIARIVCITILLVGLCWAILTLWVEQTSHPYTRTLGAPDARLKACIVYDPDPFANLDQQVCESFAQGLVDKGWYVHITSVASVPQSSAAIWDLYVFGANTYNWAPDWAVADYIRDTAPIQGKPVVALTLGAGSTDCSQRLLEELIQKKGGRLLASRSYWLWRPNDESRLDESNRQIAAQQARRLGQQTDSLLSVF